MMTIFGHCLICLYNLWFLICRGVDVYCNMQEFCFYPVEFRDAFALFDKRGDNKIDSDQIGDVLRALNLNPSQAEVKKIVQEIDPKGIQYNTIQYTLLI